MTPDHGLTEVEAAERRRTHGPNTLSLSVHTGLLRQVLTTAAQPLTLVLMVAALATIFALGDVIEGCAIAVVVTANVAIEVVLQHRAAGALAALSALNPPSARVVRAGQLTVIPAADVVVGDLVEIAAGDRVPADLSLRSAVALAIDESILTGESLPVDKARDDDAFGGTLVHRGSGSGEVVAIGRASAIGQIAASIGVPSVPPLVRELRQVAARVSVAAILVGITLGIVVARRSDEGAGDVVLAMVALAVAAIPEGLPSTVIAALALGARTMAARGAIVQNLAAIDAIGATQVLCTDKTGTITTGQLRLDAVHPVGEPGRLWAVAARCNDAHDGVGDPIDVLLAEAARHHAVEPSERLDARPFDSRTRTMAVLDRTTSGHLVVSVKGAAEDVLQRCREGADRAYLTHQAEDLVHHGSRVLAFATAETADLDCTDLEPVGLVSLAESVRPTAADAVTGFARAGVRVVMATGDHAATAAAVARSVGLTADRVGTGALDPSSLEPMDLIARVDPATKVALVDAHQERGRVVAMMGDGVNDAPALERADVGIAVGGQGGTDVARSVADVVITDGDLGTILVAVREGRRIYRNLTTATAYLLAGNLSEVLVFVGALALFPDVAVPLLPVQVLWLNLITDGLPAVALGTDEPPVDLLALSPRRRGHILDRTAVRLIARRATLIASLVLVSTWLTERHGTDVAVRTQLLLTLIATHLLFALVARAERHTFAPGWTRHRFLHASLGGLAVLQLMVFLLPGANRVLSVQAPSTAGWIATTAAMVSLVVIVDGERWWMTFGPGRRSGRGGT